ncbi:unnamed protein product [Prorocentrum cordatum]|uniref:VPS9 domain-containing protein n=1 Tax=Prorocentrum cordatum TaxID=2364126 RepID=A0ABN9XCB0_9DINO|nr:unnamed protein product [Polarella glacialis]
MRPGPEEGPLRRVLAADAAQEDRAEGAGGEGPAGGGARSSSSAARPSRQGGAADAAPPAQTAYAAFREALRQPALEPFAARLQDGFPGGLRREEAAKRVHRFLSGASAHLLSESPAFAAAAASEEGRASVVEGLEKFLLTKLHGKVFAGEPADAAEDATLRERIRGLCWLDCEHLGIPPVDPDLLAEAAGQLREMDNYRAPHDKLVVLLNACRVINHILKRTVAERAPEATGRPLSADDFLPVLIYAVLAANPPRLHSNVEFVSAFRHPSRLVGEDAYFLTALQSAVAFIRSAGPKEVDLEREEFDRRCAEALASRADACPEGPQAATAAARALELAPEQAARLRARAAAVPLRFEGVECAAQLRMGDVPVLLDEYRQMAALLRDVARGTLV